MDLRMGSLSRPARPALLLFVLLAVIPVLLAQAASCPAIVEAALSMADTLCQPTGRNQACYGHVSLEANPQPSAPVFQFESAGDIVDVNLLRSLRTMPLNPEAGTWGIAILRLQANLPATLPGQNVTFVLFGDAEITTDDDAPADVPMKAFYLRSTIGDSLCDEAPESGLLVQTPEGAGEVTFNINGVDVSMGSTVLFRAQPEGEMTISTLEGSAFLEGEGETVPVLAGTRARVPVDDQLRAERSQLSEPEPYELRRLEDVPIRLLEQPIAINRPLTQAEVRELQRRLAAGEAICGTEPFPACDKMPRRALIRSLREGRTGLEDRLQCVFRRYPGEAPLPEAENRPFCDTLPLDELPCQFFPETGAASAPRRDRRPICPQLPPPTDEVPFVEIPQITIGDRTCVDAPRPDDPSLSASENLPLCPDPNASPPLPDLSETIEQVTEPIDEVVDKVGETVEDVVDEVRDNVGEVVDEVDDTVDDVVDKIDETVDDILDKADDLLGRTLPRLPRRGSREN